MARVLKPGGIASFLTITFPPELSHNDRRRAVELATPEAAAVPGYAELLDVAGFVAVEIVDMTSAYGDTLRLLLDAWLGDADAIEGIIGPEEFEDRIRRRKNSIIGVSEGLHERIWVTARVPV